jgi:beta-N-acetylhexosaminidase
MTRSAARGHLRYIRRVVWLGMVLVVLGTTGKTYAITQTGLYTLGITYFDLAMSCNDGTPGTAPTTSTASASSETNAQQIASTFIVGFNASTPKAVITDLATKYHIGGMYLIGTHDAAAAGFNKAFYDSLSQAAGKQLVFASDEEGGQITRYAYPANSFPAPSAMASQSDAAVTDIGKKAGTVMAGNGLTTDLAPVLDLRSVGVSGRSFSSDPNVVADKAGAFTEGLKASNIKPVFKHFPGFDNTTSGNTDNAKVVMTGSIDKTVAPYKTLLAKYPDAAVMLSNMYVNALDQNYPSSMSTATVQYLRSTLGFSGLITTDDLGVTSVTTKAGSLPAAVSGALQAGVTMPLFTLSASSQTIAEGNLDKIVAAVQSNSAAMAAVTSNQNIIQKFKGGAATVNNKGGCCNSGSAALVGNDNQTKIWNYFIKAGVGPAGTAGIMGNMSAESGFNPTSEQNPGAWEDLSSRNINEGGKGGVGLVQWDGGRRPAVIKYLLSHGLTDAELHQASDKLLTGELDYTMQELNGNYKSTLDALKAEKDPAQAAFIFHKGYEVSADSQDAIRKNRMDVAASIYSKFSGSSAGGSTASSEACSQNQSPNCNGAQGSPKIICAAKAYDSASYVFGAGHGPAAEWHKNCPTIGPSCSLDCSGLVNLAVYDAFNIDLREDTGGERADKTHWETVIFNKVQPGDIMQPDSGHVEIVDHIVGQTIYTFGAHQSGIPQPQQVSPDKYTYNSNMIFMHFKG